MANGIENIYVKVAHSNKSSTKELCVIDDSGAETCITKTQLDNLLLNASAYIPEPSVSDPIVEPIVESTSTTTTTDSVTETTPTETTTTTITEPVVEPTVELTPTETTTTI